MTAIPVSLKLITLVSAIHCACGLTCCLWSGCQWTLWAHQLASTGANTSSCFHIVPESRLIFSRRKKEWQNISSANLCSRAVWKQGLQPAPAIPSWWDQGPQHTWSSQQEPTLPCWWDQKAHCACSMQPRGVDYPATHPWIYSCHQ